MKLAKKIKKAIVILLCISMVMTNVLPSFAEGNNESEPAIEEVVENEAEEAIEEIVEDEPEENSEDIEVEVAEDEVCEEDSEEDLSEEFEENLEMNNPEDIEEEPEEDTYEEEPEEDLSEDVEDTPEEVEEDINVASPSEIVDEEGEEEDSIPADMVEEPEEDEVIDEPEEELMISASVASPSDTEEVEEETEEEIEEATPSELEVEDEEVDKASPSEIEDTTTEYFIREVIVDNIKIILTAEHGVFPEAAELWAEKVEDETVAEAIEEAVDKERDNNVNVATSYKFDIKMFVNGEEVQPDTNKGSVKVIFTLAEELSECLDVNAYHLKEESDGELTAENLGAEVKTVGTDEDGVISDGTIEDDETKKVTKIEAETDGFSYYVVEFTYQLLSYTLIGSTTKLSNILSEFGITATPSEVTVSDEELFTVTKDANDEDWTIKVLQNFVSALMRVTIDSNQEYEISLSSALDSAPRQNITYIDETGAEQNENCIIITSADGYTFESNEWYAVIADVTIKTRIENTAGTGNPSHLILVDGATLTAPKGIHNRDGNGLVIYGQSAGTGTITIQNVDGDNAGIGGNWHKNGGVLIINGGNITVTGGHAGGAGIGGGYCGEGGNITINGGNVTAKGGYDASGIGLGRSSFYGNVTINGGTVNAYGGGQWGKAIGDGDKTIKPELTIYAGDSKETAKYSNPEGVDARYAFISDACAKVVYTVSHQWQKEDASGYEVHETETLYGGVGWQTEAVANSYDKLTVQSFSQETIASDESTVVVIKYNRNTYTITFDTNGRAIALEPIKTNWGAAINPPQEPVAEGYQFIGWYTERECINMYTFNTMPAENKTLYAKWSVDPSKRQNIQYIDEDGSTNTISCIILSMNADYYTFDTGEWYAVTGNVTIGNRIENEAPEGSPAHLILIDEALMTVKGGIHNLDGKELVIYGQSGENGVLTITDVPQEDAAIGGNFHENGGKVTINGGSVNVEGGRYGAGIGGGQDGDGGNFTINGGSVTATGGYEGSGIGGGLSGNGGSITINGGTVIATGGEFGPGIGAGRHTTGATLVFGSNPRVLKAGSSIEDISNIDVDTYKNTHQNYNFVIINYATQIYIITWKDWDGNVLAVTIIDEGALPKYPGASQPSRSGYIFTGWTPEIGLATDDKTYTATYKKKSSGGGGGGGSAGIPRYDSLGNIIGPSAIQNYAYDGTNPPDLSGSITVSQWDYNTKNSQVTDIHYVKNIDSFVRGNNTPVVTEWLGITTNTITKVLWYRTNANGQILRNQFIQIGNNIYYFDNNGIMVTGQHTINGKVYNFETTVGATEGRFLY